MPAIFPTSEYLFKIALIGEWPDESGQWNGEWILEDILNKVGLLKESCFVSNVFNESPQDPKLFGWTEKKGKHHNYDDIPFCLAKPMPYGGYLKEKYWFYLDSLFDDLRSFGPDLIFCMGATPLWALTGRTDIGTARATLITTSLGPVISTYHPSSVLHGSYANRVIIRADLEKGLQWLKNPSQFTKARRVYIPSSVKDAMYLRDKLLGMNEISCDIETCQGLIDMVGFAWSPEESCLFPFAKTEVKGKSFVVTGPYWENSLDFMKVWRCVQTVLEQGGKMPCSMDTLADRLPKADNQIHYTIRRLYG